MRESLCVAIAVSILFSGCGGKKRPAQARTARVGWSESGVASWYGHPYHGRRAANGEVYDMEKMTAAHRTLPFGTWVQVRNLTNDKTVNVRITDRGPFIGGRIVDLSRAAASSIELIGPGIAKVRLTVIDPPPVRAGALPAETARSEFGVQVGSFTDRANAARVQSEMERRYGSAKIVMRDAQPPQWRVVVGNEPGQEEAAALAAKIRSDPEAEAAEAFVVRLDGVRADGL